MALHLDVEPGDTIRIGPHTTVRIERKSGQRTRLRIDSTEDISQYKSGDRIPELATLLARQRVPARTPAHSVKPKLLLKRP